MADVFTKKKRSAVMSRIRGKGNKSTEMRLITLMREQQIKGWRRNHRLPGRPDFVFLRQKVAVFVDGCFWHGCPLHYSEPSTATEFWRTKITGNQARDLRNTIILRKMGWRVVRIWEHDLKKDSRSAATIGRILLSMQKGQTPLGRKSGKRSRPET
jgi:DNA mismatch endonuclease (patch repair protein)